VSSLFYPIARTRSDKSHSPSGGVVNATLAS
jgi:hypothetical protein